jgi:hypothetical protein
MAPNLPQGNSLGAGRSSRRGAPLTTVRNLGNPFIPTLASVYRK